MPDPEDHPREEAIDSSAFQEAYLEAVKRLRNSLVHQSSFTSSEGFKRALEGIQKSKESNETRQKALLQALEFFQTSYAPLRLRAEISGLEKKAHKQAEDRVY
jgi:hypothetical protein